ncbi:MAG: Nif3-like dinuclear metal center hexameric protein [Chlorobi bacterium]|nr:Nif3-like dinuclear metal center hexameric protein [Chlorobiota bacterium]
MILKKITSYLEKIADLHYQESYDNSGLIVGNPEQEIKSALICIDVTEAVIEEALQNNINLIISHHPVLFGSLKKITGKNYVERILIKAIKNDIAVYALHTNLDNVFNGVNGEICKRLALSNCRILKPVNELLYKLVTFIPVKSLDKVSKALFSSGAGNIGNYDSCSFNTEGFGTFRANEAANPFVGEKGKLHKENEVRFETIFPKHLTANIIQALVQSHPYEEVAYDIYPLMNTYNKIGAGMIGELEHEISEADFLRKIKNIFNSGVIRHTELLNRKITKVAFCGGSGSFLLQEAMRKNADIFITADFKYHQFFDAEGKILIADIGHYESEQFTKYLIYNLLIKKFPKFALHLSKINTNPIKYL